MTYIETYSGQWKDIYSRTRQLLLASIYSYIQAATIWNFQTALFYLVVLKQLVHLSTFLCVALT